MQYNILYTRRRPSKPCGASEAARAHPQRAPITGGISRLFVYCFCVCVCVSVYVYIYIYMYMYMYMYIYIYIYIHTLLGHFETCTTPGSPRKTVQCPMLTFRNPATLCDHLQHPLAPSIPIPLQTEHNPPFTLSNAPPSFLQVAGSARGPQVKPQTWPREMQGTYVVRYVRRTARYPTLHRPPFAASARQARATGRCGRLQRIARFA